MRKTGGRHELKHHINDADFLQLRARLPYIAMPDENAQEKDGYRVRSLYFDNYNDKALKEKIDGVDDREKFRLRLYNANFTFIRLEKKSKKGGLCFKESTTLTKEEVAALLKGDCEVLLENGSPLCLELYTKMNTHLLRPKNIVDYKREAYVFRAGNVRITLDYDIRTTTDVHTFLSSNMVTIPIPKAIILEVKYDNFLPEIMRGMVALSGRQSTAFSKYASTRMI